MTKLLDRLLVYSYLKAYTICLVSMLSLYIVVDLFTNMDDFTQHNHSFAGVMGHIATYYGIQTPVIFDRLCEVIVLLAAMFTIAWVQRSNELIPLLSAGVSTHRVVRPVLFSACAMLVLTVLNQEILIPKLGAAVLFGRDDPEGERDLYATPTWEPNKILIGGRQASRRELLVREFTCTIPEDIGPGNITVLQAAEARYVPPDVVAGKPKRRTGGWLLSGTMPLELPNWNRTDVVELIAPGKFFLYTSEVTFDVATRDRKWFYRASTVRLFAELGKAETNRLASMAVVFHMRLTRPILGMILVFLGLSVILRDQNRNVFISAGLCLGLCVLFFAAGFGCKYLGEKELVSPALAAWLPVLLFGPLSFSMFDAIHT